MAYKLADRVLPEFGEDNSVSCANERDNLAPNCSPVQRVDNAILYVRRLYYQPHFGAREQGERFQSSPIGDDNETRFVC